MRSASANRLPAPVTTSVCPTEARLLASTGSSPVDPVEGDRNAATLLDRFPSTPMAHLQAHGVPRSLTEPELAQTAPSRL